MPRHEFEYWKEKYVRSPWGIVSEDRRNANICIYLQGIINMWSKTKQKIAIDALFQDKTGEEYEKIKSQLYSMIEAPWLMTGMTQEELALEGQAIFAALEERFG